jgi:hypothetical protein
MRGRDIPVAIIAQKRSLLFFEKKDENSHPKNIMIAPQNTMKILAATTPDETWKARSAVEEPAKGVR